MRQPVATVLAGSGRMGEMLELIKNATNSQGVILLLLNQDGSVTHEMSIDLDKRHALPELLRHLAGEVEKSLQISTAATC